MTTIMDIAFSIFIGGTIILIILNANFTVREIWAYYNSEYMVNQTLINVSQVLESELRNMGAGIEDNGNSILEARDTAIQFQFVPDGSSTAKTIKYYKGSTSELASTDNPNDAYLYRQVNSGAPQPIGIVTKFQIRYLQNRVEADSLGNIIFDGVAYLDNPQPSIVQMVEITLEVQNPYSMMSLTEENIEDPNKRYAMGVWKQTRLASHNLRR
ncbi:MAG TPA: hypothetical protein PK595_03835 [Bacteroidota bacterium]|jgi:hypothetical protein|nr:hypothetical protein [Bacteroidota bacterium]